MRYLQIAPLLIVQPGTLSNHRAQPALGGTVQGVSVAFGAFVRPTLAFEVEVVATRTLSRPQHYSYDYTEDYIAQSRDLLFSLNARGHFRRLTWLEVSAGAGLAASTFGRRSIVRYTPYLDQTSAEPGGQSTSPRRTFAAGIAAIWPVSRRVSIVPKFSLRWVNRSEQGIASFMGVGRLGFQFGAAALFR